MEADGSSSKEFPLRGVAPDSKLAWTPDGKNLVFHTFDYTPNLKSKIIKLNLETLEVQELVSQGTHPAVSPDGKNVIFTKTFYKTGYTRDIYMVDIQGNNLKQITGSFLWKNDAKISFLSEMIDETYPRWSPDGTSIVFYANIGGYYRRWDLIMFNLFGGNSADNLTRGTLNVSYDKKEILFAGLDWNR
jgi:Tol biopolymer transport system component